MEHIGTYILDNWLEIFSLVSGIIFLILEVKQKNAMWIVSIFSSSVAAVVFLEEKLYASMALNIYYVIAAFWGIFTWLRDSKTLNEVSGGSDDSGAGGGIHLRKISAKVVVISLLALAIFTPVFKEILAILGDSSSILDAIVFVLSVIATVWLVKTYLQQWLVWILADILSTTLCLTQGMYWMAALYAFYTLSAIYGYIHWKRNGVYI